MLPHTSGFELSGFLQEARYVLGGAGRRKRAGYSKHGNGFAGARLSHFHRIRANAAAIAFDFNVFHQRGRGKGVANFDHE